MVIIKQGSGRQWGSCTNDVSSSANKRSRERWRCYGRVFSYGVRQNDNKTVSRPKVTWDGPQSSSTDGLGNARPAGPKWQKQGGTLRKIRPFPEEHEGAGNRPTHTWQVLHYKEGPQGVMSASRAMSTRTRGRRGSFADHHSIRSPAERKKSVVALGGSRTSPCRRTRGIKIAIEYLHQLWGRQVLFWLTTISVPIIMLRAKRGLQYSTSFGTDYGGNPWARAHGGAGRTGELGRLRFVRILCRTVCAGALFGGPYSGTLCGLGIQSIMWTSLK